MPTRRQRIHGIPSVAIEYVSAPRTQAVTTRPQTVRILKGIGKIVGLLLITNVAIMAAVSIFIHADAMDLDFFRGMQSDLLALDPRNHNLIAASDRSCCHTDLSFFILYTMASYGAKHNAKGDRRAHHFRFDAFSHRLLVVTPRRHSSSFDHEWRPGVTTRKFHVLRPTSNRHRPPSVVH